MSDEMGAIKCNVSKQKNIPAPKKPGELEQKSVGEVARASYERLSGSVFGEKLVPELETKVTYTPTEVISYDYRNQWNDKDGFVEPKMDANNKITQQSSIKATQLPSVFTVTAFTLRGANEGSTLSLSKVSQDWGAQFELINANKSGKSAEVVTEGEYNAFIADYEREAGTTASEKRDLNETVVSPTATEENKKAMFNAMAGADNKLTKAEYSDFMKGLMAKGEVEDGDNGDVTKVTTEQFVDYVNSKTTETPLDKTKPVGKTETAVFKGVKVEPEFPVPSAQEFNVKYNLDIDPKIVLKYQEKTGGGKTGFEVQLKDGTFIRNLSDKGAVVGRTKSKNPPAISYDAGGKLVIANAKGLEVIAGAKLAGVSFDNCTLCEYQSTSKDAKDNVTLNNSDYVTMILDKGRDVVKATGNNNRYNTVVKADSNLSILDSSKKQVNGETVEQENKLIIDADYDGVHDDSEDECLTSFQHGISLSKLIREKNNSEKFWKSSQLNFNKNE